ncbi:MAG: ferritin-like domain-containing protein [Pseudomonadota bacterium]
MTELSRLAVPASKTTEGVARRRFLAWSSTALLGALAFGGNLPGLSIEQAFAQTPGGANGKAVDLGEGDVGILNYAYALEQLEAAFYTQVMKTPYANMASADRDILTGIRDHEIAHRDFFKAALKKNAIPALDVDFSKIDFNSRDSVLSTAETFENLGVAAYNGAGQLLEKGEYLLLAGKIVSVEARHAAAIRHLIGMKSSGATASATPAESPVNDKGLDQALKPADVLSKAGPFVKTPITADDIG